MNEALEKGEEVPAPELTASVTEPARVLSPLLADVQEVNGASGDDSAGEERTEEEVKQKQHEAVVLSMEETK